MKLEDLSSMKDNDNNVGNFNLESGIELGSIINSS